MSVVTYSIIVDEAHLEATEAIADVVRHKGLTVTRIVIGAGAIQATGSDADLRTLENLDGVMEVRPERNVKLPPLDSDVPQ
jgi:hypothetical protein